MPVRTRYQDPWRRGEPDSPEIEYGIITRVRQNSVDVNLSGKQKANVPVSEQVSADLLEVGKPCLVSSGVVIATVGAPRTFTHSSSAVGGGSSGPIDADTLCGLDCSDYTVRWRDEVITGRWTFVDAVTYEGGTVYETNITNTVNAELLVSNGTYLTVDATAEATTITVNDPIFTYDEDEDINSLIKIRRYLNGGIRQEFLRIISDATEVDEGWQYTVERAVPDVQESTAQAWPKGTALTEIGRSDLDDGWYGGWVLIKGVGDGSPSIRVQQRTGVNPSDVTAVYRSGNLNGALGHGPNDYGLAIGDLGAYSLDKRFLTFLPDEGFKLQNVDLELFDGQKRTFTVLATDKTVGPEDFVAGTVMVGDNGEGQHNMYFNPITGEWSVRYGTQPMLQVLDGRLTYAVQGQTIFHSELEDGYPYTQFRGLFRGSWEAVGAGIEYGFQPHGPIVWQMLGRNGVPLILGRVGDPDDPGFAYFRVGPPGPQPNMEAYTDENDNIIFTIDGQLIKADSINIADLLGVSLTSPLSGHLFGFDGTSWVNDTPANWGLSELGHTHTESDITDLGDYLLRNGTLAMTGNLDLDGNDVLDPGEFYQTDGDFLWRIASPTDFHSIELYTGASIASRHATYNATFRVWGKGTDAVDNISMYHNDTDGVIGTGAGNLKFNPAGNVDAGSKRILNVTNPSSAQDAATKAYVDTYFAALTGATFSGAVVINSSLDVSGFLALKAPTEVTISSGAVTVTQSFHTVDTESDAATDDLDTINGGSTNGQRLILRPISGARTVVLKHNTGNIWFRSGSDVTLDDWGDIVELTYFGGWWLGEG